MNNWIFTAPTEPGKYLFRCGELDYAEETREVFMNSHGVLWVTCPDTGHWPVDTYHYNLIEPSWKKL